MNGQKEIIPSNEQEEVIKLTEGQHLVLAPPGTGKTEVLARRVDFALNNGIEPNKMICLTFTNRAAKGMLERIEEKHPGADVFIGNIHRFCSNFLYRNKIVPQITALLDEEDSNLLMQEALDIVKNETRSYKEKIEELLKLNARIKQQNNGFPQELISYKKVEIKNFNLATKVCEYYEELKKESQLLDFDDLLFYTYLELTRDSKKQYPKYSWIQVDEVQDLTPLQWEIINLISEDTAHKVFFGDYEQAIFSFMGAKINALKSIEKNSTTHPFKRNYRSPNYLLQVYKTYAKTQLDATWVDEVFTSKILPHNKNDLILARVEGTKDDEAEFIVTNCLPKFTEEENSTTAILVRFNNTADIYGQKLKMLEEKNFFKVSGYDMFRRAIIKDTLALLSSMQDKYDRLSWSRLFRLFAKIPTLKEARAFVNSLFLQGFIPTDFLSERYQNVMAELQTFFNEKRIVVFDTETTGLNVYEDDIIQMAAVEINRGVIGEEFNIYIKTEKSLEATVNIHNITTEKLKNEGKERYEALKLFNEFVNGDVLLAHNLEFDWEILQSNITRHNLNFDYKHPNIKFDSIEITKRIFPKLHSYKLEFLIEKFRLQGINSHNALDDVRATAELVRFLVPKIDNIIKNQNSFLKEKESRKHLANLRKNLYPFWSKYYHNPNNITHLKNIVENFIDYKKKLDNSLFPIEEWNAIEKLNKHLECKTTQDRLKVLLNKHVPDYKRYKESDLITGAEKIVISTIHKAKGLEFDNVIIPECVSGVYPFYKSKTKEEIKEDARMLYVAMTRAKKRLIITTFSTSNGYKKKPSSFLIHIKEFFKIIDISPTSRYEKNKKLC